MTYVQEALDAVSEELPGQDVELVRLYTLLALVRGSQVSVLDVHDAWAIWCQQKNPHHQSIVPFGDLSPEIQKLDVEYVEGIRRAVSRLHTHWQDLPESPSE